MYALTPFWSSLAGLSQDTIPSEPVAWEIIHPGWRFIKIKRAIQGDGITLSDISDAGEITRHIAKKRGWVEPKKAADELLDSCKKDELKSYIMKDFIEAVEDINALRFPMRSPYDRHRALLVSPLRRMSRGPNRSDRFARYAVAVWEVTTQLYFDHAVFCPDCLSYVHLPQCRLRLYIEQVNRVSRYARIG